MSNSLKGKDTDIDSVEKNRLNPFLPSYCCFSITMECFFSCKNCYIWKQQKNLSKELPIIKWIEAARHLPELLDKDIDIIVTGGEPLLKEGVLDLIAFCTSMGYRVSLQTNAFLINEELAKRLADAGLWRTCISLYSLNPEIHDFLRGKRGVHKKTLEAIDFLAKFAPGIGINIQTVIMDINLEEIVTMSDWVEKNSMIDYILYLAPMLPFGAVNSDKLWYNEDIYKFMWPQDIVKVDFILRELINRKSYFKKIANTVSQLQIFKKYFDQSLIGNNTNCALGLRDMNIDPKGNVFLCFLKPSIGNIQKNSLKNIWLSEEAEAVRLEMNRCKGKCHFLINCSFSKSDFDF